MNYYNQSKKKISQKEFIESYNNSYYIGAQRLVKGTVQNSCYTEKEIDRLLEEGITNKKDVMHILAWKIGKIRHFDSKERWVFHKGCENTEDGRMKLRNGEIDFNSFAEYIVDNIMDLERKSISQPQEVLNELKNEAPSGVGTVYLITILYFLSKGEIPIYDKFAKIAVDAIKSDTIPGEYVEYCELPEKNSEKFDCIMDEIFSFKADIEAIFGEDYKKNRNVDRALWVYGHSFEMKNLKTVCG